MPHPTAAGSFDVSLTPLPLDQSGDDSARGRLRLDKRFHGGLDASGAGEMTLIVGGGRHDYRIDATVPDAP